MTKDYIICQIQIFTGSGGAAPYQYNLDGPKLFNDRANHSKKLKSPEIIQHNFKVTQKKLKMKKCTLVDNNSYA